MTPPDALHAPLPATAVLSAIGRGADAAVPLSAIAERLGMGRRQTERALQALVDAGEYPIVAGARGYWLADSPDELTAYMATLRHRALEIFRRYRGVGRARDRMGAQLSLW